MKHRSRFSITGLAKSKKLFLSIFSLILAVTMCFVTYGTAIPTYAATEYVPVNITVDMLLSMFAAGDLTVSCTVVNTSSTTRAIQYWDIVNGESGSLPQGANLNLFSARANQVYSNQTLFWFPFNFYLLNGQAIQTIYTLSMPFDYVGTNQSEVIIGAFTPGRMTTAVNSSLSIYDSDDNLIDSFTQTTFNQSYLPSDNPIYSIIEANDPNYEFSALYMYNTLIFIMNSQDVPINSFNFVSNIMSSGTTSDNDCIMGLFLNNFTVYVPDVNVDPDDPDSPEYSTVVEEYLQAIVNPSPETQQRADALRDELSNVDLNLTNLSSQLQVQQPNISDVAGNIDSTLLAGSTVFATEVLNPILNQGVVVALFTGVFAIVSLKLILFGSGKS